MNNSLQDLKRNDAKITPFVAPTPSRRNLSFTVSTVLLLPFINIRHSLARTI